MRTHRAELCLRLSEHDRAIHASSWRLAVDTHQPVVHPGSRLVPPGSSDRQLRRPQPRKRRLEPARTPRLPLSATTAASPYLPRCEALVLDVGQSSLDHPDRTAAALFGLARVLGPPTAPPHGACRNVRRMACEIQPRALGRSNGRSIGRVDARRPSAADRLTDLAAAGGRNRRARDRGPHAPANLRSGEARFGRRSC